MKRLLALTLLMLPAPALASCPAANSYSFAFANEAAATLAYGGSYTYTATTSGGATRTFSTAIAQNGLTSTTGNGQQLPNIGTLITGADATRRDLVLGGTFGGRTIDINSGTRVITVTFTFAQPIRDLALTLHDIDFSSNQYRDWLQVAGVGNGVTYTPAMSSPAGNANASGAARTATGSSLSFGPAATPVILTQAQAAGVSTSNNNSADGQVDVSFAQPVTSVTIRYGNAPLTGTETNSGQQAIGIAGLSFCPMPAVTVAKSSAPVAGSYGAFNLPGEDVTYTLTVTNTGGSPVDAGAIVLTDLLPAGVTFKNVAGPNGTPFTLAAGSSGVTLASGGASYSGDGGASWSYAPTAGYDTGVKGVRVVPSGAMAPNSSFAVSFVARVK